MKNHYQNELNTMISAMKEAYVTFGSPEHTLIQDKTTFDLVTDIDLNIEKFLIQCIQTNFPNDKILSEETNASTIVDGRTWTIDPIDGTYNMSNGIPLFGIQCALYDQGNICVAIIFLPQLNELYTAVTGDGAYLNGSRIFVKKNDLEHSTLSFGDFPHSRPADTYSELHLISYLTDKIAKIRMFGSAAIDFAWLAAGRTNGTILFTKNKWDIAPGILMAREAGAWIMSRHGQYNADATEIIAVATEELYQTIKDGLQ